MALSDFEKEQIEQFCKKYPDRKSAVMDSLRMIQQSRRFIPTEERGELAAILGMPEKDIEGVISFYTMYTEEPLGKHHIQVCTNISCKLRGGDEIYEFVKVQTNLKNGETDPNGLFSLEEVECMGACGGAPMIAINEHFYEKIDKETISKLLGSLRVL